LPSSTMLARTSPQNALLIEPIRNMVSGSGFLFCLSLMLPKLVKAVSPLRTARKMNPGTLAVRNVIVPVKSTTSVRNLSSALAGRQTMSSTAAIAATDASQSFVRMARNAVSLSNPVQQSGAPATTFAARASKDNLPIITCAVKTSPTKASPVRQIEVSPWPVSIVASRSPD
jgi:hypothetical protein